jgi:hypothetical protein
LEKCAGYSIIYKEGKIFMEETIIYVELVERSEKPVFAPVKAKSYGQGFFEILNQGRDDYESLRFKEGEFVFCFKVQFESKKDLTYVAYSLMKKEAVLYITVN